MSLRVPVYLLCFTAAKDDDHFWSCDYSEQGAGVCLGVRFLGDDKPPSVPGLGSGFIQVDYNQASWRKSVLKHFQMVLEEMPLGQIEATLVDLAVSALNRIAAFAAIQGKEESWANEKELRWAAMTTPDCPMPVLERESRGRRLRYIELPAREEGKSIVLDEVVLGPHQDQAVGRQRIEALLQSLGYPNDDAPWPTIASSVR